MKSEKCKWKMKEVAFLEVMIRPENIKVEQIKLILVVPDLDKKIRIEVDALDYTIEGVLSIECEDG